MTPAYIISLEALERNARILRQTAQAAGCRIVMALKGFALWPVFEVLRPYLDGCCASGVWEARLAREEFQKSVLTYAPGYDLSDIEELLEVTDHLDFNSLSQWERFQGVVMKHPRFVNGQLKCGLRVNPRFSTGHTALYDPCVPGSRLGIISDLLIGANLQGISGLHMHTLCEQGAEDLEATLKVLERDFGFLLKKPEITWLNLGGGHWITQPDYDRELLIRIIQRLKAAYQVDVWLEPGEAVAIHTGVLRCHVLDVFQSEGYNHAILNVSASAHMPDVLEMPYRPDVFLVERGESTCEEDKNPAVVLPGESYCAAGQPGGPGVTIRLGAATCLSGDIIGDYAFPRMLRPGDELVFDDMSHYTMVKTTFFNGVQHPDIFIEESGNLRLVRHFSYDDFRSRLG